MDKSLTSNKWWALVRFPNEGDAMRILLVSEISHKVIALGNEVAYRPQNLKDFIHMQPYRIRTNCDALDGQEHSYYCQIYKLSDNKQELQDLLAPGAKRLNWTRINHFPKDPETSCDEAHKLAGSGVLMPKKKERTVLRQLNRENQNSHLDAALRHLSNSNFSPGVISNMSMSDDHSSQVPTSEHTLEEKYVQEIQRLQEQLRIQREELEEVKRRNAAAAVSHNTINELKKDLTDFLNQRMLAIAEHSKNMVEQVTVQNAQLKEEISGLRSVVSNRAGSEGSESAVSYVTLPCGLRIKAAYESRFKSCNSPKDFEQVLLHACFENPENMRMRKGPMKFTEDWLSKAGAYYSEWLSSREEISPSERIKLINKLGANLSKSNRNKNCRGVNLAMRTAREKGRCPKEAKEVYVAGQAALEAAGSKRKARGGRPKSSKRSSNASATTGPGSETQDNNGVQLCDVASGSGASSFRGVNDIDLGPGPLGPHAQPWTGYVAYQFDEEDDLNKEE
ncbi:Cilia- and flagella-associated protein 97 [Frankliniella fusca]|uniref:Cilia- and flagella-associated protein 97 n=1 Tax=Frankliniella fusca TaxID=407009 RepID=A0AAE1LQQ1_9NEOP|nr:Cilia- and flagella-associated protein 97 [Frankliniella fusca]